MQNVQKFVMVPFDKYKRLNEARPIPEEKFADVDEEKIIDNEIGEGAPPPPPGLPEKPARMRWLTLPEVQ